MHMRWIVLLIIWTDEEAGTESQNNLLKIT